MRAGMSVILPAKGDHWQLQPIRGLLVQPTPLAVTYVHWANPDIGDDTSMVEFLHPDGTVGAIDLVTWLEFYERVSP